MLHLFGIEDCALFSATNGHEFFTNRKTRIYFKIIEEIKRNYHEFDKTFVCILFLICVHFIQKNSCLIREKFVSIRGKTTHRNLQSFHLRRFFIIQRAGSQFFDSCRHLIRNFRKPRSHRRREIIHLHPLRLNSQFRQCLFDIFHPLPRFQIPGNKMAVDPATYTPSAPFSKALSR